MKLYINEDIIRISPFVVLPGQHALTIYYIEDQNTGKKYTYYKCTKLISELRNNNKIDIKSKFKNRNIIVLSPKELSKFLDLQKSIEVVVLKNVSFETIVQFLSSNEQMQRRQYHTKKEEKNNKEETENKE